MDADACACSATVLGVGSSAMRCNILGRCARLFGSSPSVTNVAALRGLKELKQRAGQREGPFIQAVQGVGRYVTIVSMGSLTNCSGRCRDAMCGLALS